MEYSEQALRARVALGEDSTHQFKADISSPGSLAAELAAFANSEGGELFLGVADDGTIPGLSFSDVARLNQLVSNVTSTHIRGPLHVLSQNVGIGNGRIVVVVTVPKGIDKPYFDKDGVIWLKDGADKRRITSKGELRRIFQMTNQIHADELSANARADTLDKLVFRDFLRDRYDMPFPESKEELLTLLQDMNLATESGFLNYAGVLLFAERPELSLPSFVVKASCYPGTRIPVSDYIDVEEFAGPLPRLFKDVFAFVRRNLRKVQGAYGINEPGDMEVPGIVFEELLVNALVHRDYLISRPICVNIFDDRVEFVSPGCLPNSLTVEKIRRGNSVIRNPILVSYAAKGLLPYRGVGSGIYRALKSWDRIEFADDREDALFRAVVYRPCLDAPRPSRPAGRDSGPRQERRRVLLAMVRDNPRVTVREIAAALGVSARTVMGIVARLREEGVLRRTGSTRSGSWQVVMAGDERGHPEGD